jgi:GNAT superfamily N-acetyltransferase
VVGHPIIRLAERDDVPAIVALLADDVIGSQREAADSVIDEAYWDAFDDVDRTPNVEQWVIEHDGRLVGCFELIFIPGLSRGGGLRAQIEAVRIVSDLRGQGVGALAMQWAIDRARDKGCVVVQLTTDKQRQGAHRLYERLGFQASHEGMKLRLR